MPEKLKEISGKGKEWWKKTTKKTKVLLGSVLIAVLVAVGIITAVNLNQPYAVLFTGLNQSELSDIVSYLSDNGVSDYRINGDDTILVPQNQVNQLKADLVVQDYPKSGSSHSTYFDNVGMLTTESERNTLYFYDLEDSLEAVIRCMDGVSDATVNVTPQEDNSYVLDKSSTLEAKASVMVVMENGGKLSNQQVSGIRNLVSHAVQGLEISNVSIVDSYGNSYSSDSALSDVQDTSALKLQLEEQINNSLRSNIMQVLSPLYGSENITVSVNSIVDVDRSVTESTNYTTEDWAADGSTNGEGIIGKKIYDKAVVRGEEDTAGGTVGTETNADTNEETGGDIDTYVDDEIETNGNETQASSSGEVDYLVDQENKQVEHVAGTVSDVMVSVSINGTTAGNVDVDSLYGHIARAAGISSDMQEDKISILVEPFYQEEEPQNPVSIVSETIPDGVLYAAAGGFGLFLLLLIFFILMGRRRHRKLLAEQQAAMAEEDLPPVVKTGADVADPALVKSMNLRKDVRKFAEDNPEIAAQMLRNWLREGDGQE